MPKVTKTPLALSDLKTIVEYIAADNLTAALKWLSDIESLFNLLATQPGIGQLFHTKRLGPVRRRVFGNYLIYYRPLETGVEILRVLHGAREQDRLI